jgi:hypothetical protein
LPRVKWTQDLVPETAADFDALLDRLMPLAQERLEAEGVCWPVAAAFDRKGVATDLIDPVDGPASVRKRLDTVYDVLRDRAEWLRAVGVAADVRALGRDSLRVSLEHLDGSSADVFLSYERKGWRKKLVFDDLRVVTGHTYVFDDD